MCYFDIPLLHQNSLEGVEFIVALDHSNDMALFGTLAVQAIVNFHWHKVQKVLWALFMGPYILQLTVFFYWSNV